MAQPRAEHCQFRKDAVDLDGEHVEVRVGSALHLFIVHIKVLSKSSAFFKAALSKKWMKEETKSIDLPEDDHDTFHDYLRYLYTDQLYTVYERENPTHDFMPFEEKRKEEWRSLFKLYVLAEKLRDDALILKLLESMLSKGTSDDFFFSGQDYEEINLLYRGTTSASPARRLIVDMIASSDRFSIPRTRPAQRASYKPEFLFELVSCMLDKQAEHANTRLPDGHAASWYLSNGGYASTSDTATYGDGW